MAHGVRLIDETRAGAIQGGQEEEEVSINSRTRATTACGLRARKHSSGLTKLHESFMQGMQGSWSCSTRSSCRYGPVRRGSVGPNIATTGLPSAAATCIGPVSLVTIK